MLIVTCKTLAQPHDIARKDNIVAIDKISQFSGYTFTWKDSGLPSACVIDQEVMEVLPELISTTRDDVGSN
ncbi:tail fiber domain-containing protein [Hafnia paralvei]